MYPLKFSPLAQDDLNDIWEFIAQDNPYAATRLVDLVEQKCDLLAENPEIGRKRDDLAPELRSFPVKSYVIYYRYRKKAIEVIRVLSSARDVESLFWGTH
jgi:toxin ParE1/3/4